MRRLRLVLGTELSAKNKILAIGSLAVPVLRYSFGIVNWHEEELQKLDWKMCKLLTIHGQHHPKADVDRLYFPRKQGGRGLMQLEAAQTKLNSVALVRERTIPTERPPPVGEVSANFCG